MTSVEDAALQPVLDYLTRSMGGGSGSAPQSDVGARFAALRKKISNAADGKKQKSTLMISPSAKKLFRVDPLSQTSLPPGSGNHNTVFVSKLDRATADDQTNLLSFLEQSPLESSCLAVCVLASHVQMTQNAAWVELLGGGSDTQADFFYVVVPPTQQAEQGDAMAGGGSDLVWYCGCFRYSRMHEGAMRATIDAAVAAKKEGQSFVKVAKTWSRLGELVEGASSGGGASRMAHLFARTDPEVRDKLRMDATAAFSVTDEVTADDITHRCLALPGVVGRTGAQQHNRHQSRPPKKIKGGTKYASVGGDGGAGGGSGFAAATSAGTASTCVVDLTACVGGNVLSFAKCFDRVVGVECDPARFDLLRHNTQTVLDSFVGGGGGGGGKGGGAKAGGGKGDGGKGGRGLQSNGTSRENTSTVVTRDLRNVGSDKSDGDAAASHGFSSASLPSPFARTLSPRVELVLGDSTALLSHASLGPTSLARWLPLASVQAKKQEAEEEGDLSPSPTAPAPVPAPLLFFLDPPWGGVGYKDQAATTLELGGKSMEEVVGQCLKVPGCLHVVLKCPFNADLRGLQRLVESGGKGGGNQIKKSAGDSKRRRQEEQQRAPPFSLKMSSWSLSKKVKCIVVSPTTITTTTAAAPSFAAAEVPKSVQDETCSPDKKKKKKKKKKRSREETET
eukprot:CAMPEP_0171928586 /NCGR_PEP_ID=MMETSP0993-20121228/26894_1 /TAXON_ID=483369 /ORGANISM="non described non described, Strain CCMP2098" /LENGTH=675 /DNA_ID=CAMNT_0012567923 /DNA_START=121 /DNA_END=2148 /DNA_ORIENTATION=-